MQIRFKNARMRKICNDEKALRRNYPEQAAVIRQRLDDLAAAESMETLLSLPGGWHPLHGDRKGQWGGSLRGALRIVIRPADDPLPLDRSGGLDLKRVTSVEIVEVEDYHRG